MDLQEIWRQYERCVAYNVGEGLYETVRQNEQFYLGNQWDGLNAPDLDKPVLNFMKRVCSYIVAMLVSDDIAVMLRPFRSDGRSRRECVILQREIERVIERTKAKTLGRELLRNCVVDGDGCFFWYFDSERRNPQLARGDIALDLVDNTRVLFGNPYVSDVQKQPYIIIVKRELLDTVRRRAAELGVDSGDILPDSDGGAYSDAGARGPQLVTVLLKLYRRDDTVHFCETTRTAVLRGDTDTGYRLYPVSYMCYEKKRDSYHGQAPLTGLIPNQIAVNKLWAMAIRHQHTMAFPKIFYDRQKIKQWTNRVGEAIGINGNPGEAVFTSGRSVDMSEQLLAIVDKTISYTRDFLGASDAALGNVEPDNSSAIIALQKAAAAPLEIQRLAFYQFVEDYVNILLDMMRADYGVREVSYSDDSGEIHSEFFDFSAVDYDALSLTVEVGASSYWSELMQVQSADNMYQKGIITDAITYLECIPERYVSNKQRLLERLKEQKQSLGQAAMAPPSKQNGKEMSDIALQ